MKERSGKGGVGGSVLGSWFLVLGSATRNYELRTRNSEGNPSVVSCQRAEGSGVERRASMVESQVTWR